MTLSQIEVAMRRHVAQALDEASQPARVIVGVEAFRTLVGAYGVERDRVRVVVHGIALNVDCQRNVPDDEVWVPVLRMPMGRA